MLVRRAACCSGARLAALPPRWSSLPCTRSMAAHSLQLDEEVRQLFVYGTLRPDDVKGAPWTKRFREGLQWKRARVRSARLFADRYPFVVLSTDVQDEPAKHANYVVGYVMYSDDPARFRSKIAEADLIEGYPHYYQRSVVEAVIEEQQDFRDPQSPSSSSGAGAGEQRVKCYIYHRQGSSLAFPVWSGDWAFVGLQHPITPTDLLFRTRAGSKLTTKLG